MTRQFFMISPRKLKVFRDKSKIARKIAGRWLQWRFSGKQVKIHAFQSDATLYAEGAWIFLSWKTEYAWSLELSPAIGKLHPEGRVRIRAQVGMEGFKLKAKGPGGFVEKEIRLVVRPRNQALPDGWPTAEGAWPPRNGFAVPQALRHLMQPERQLEMRPSAAAIHFKRTENAHAFGPWKHSPPIVSIEAQLQSSPDYLSMQDRIAQIHAAKSLSELDEIAQNLINPTHTHIPTTP